MKKERILKRNAWIYALMAVALVLSVMLAVVTPSSATANTEYENIAYGKIVTASSKFSDQYGWQNVTDGDNGIDAEEEAISDDEKPILEFMKEALNGEVLEVKFSKNLGSHPVCLLAQGEVSIEMEKVFRNMPSTNANQDIRAKKVLQINKDHKIYDKIKDLYANNQDELKEVSSVLLDEAKLIEGLPIEDPTKFVELATKYMSK